MTHTWRPASMNAVTEADPAGVISGQAWDEFCESVRRTGSKILSPELPATDLDRSTGFRHLMAMLQVGINQLLATPDASRPRLGRTDAFKSGHDCTDALYRSASVDGTSTYRVTGQVGSARFLSFQTGGSEGTVDSRRSDELTTDAGGRFELWLSPQPHDGDWLRTDDQTDQLFVRQFFSDWENEVPATMTIERVGDVPGTALAPRPVLEPHAGQPVARVAGLRHPADQPQRPPGGARLRRLVSRGGGPYRPGRAQLARHHGPHLGCARLRWVLADRAPQAQVTVIPHAAIRDHLPADTPVVTPAERAAVITRRGAQVARRFAT